MPTLTAELSGGQTAFRPGDPIDGLVGWEFEGDPPKWVEVRLFWATAGKGTPDVFIADAVEFEAPAAVDAQAFRFVAPAGPFSYEGRLIEIGWGIEVVAHKTKETAQIDLTLSSMGEAVRLP
ncbi:MAG: hypothetical protein AAF333_08975 [Planctomycetota bacterium]